MTGTKMAATTVMTSRVWCAEAAFQTVRDGPGPVEVMTRGNSAVKSTPTPKSKPSSTKKPVHSRPMRANQEPQPDHQPEAPVGDPQHRHVAAGPVLGDLGLLGPADAADRAVPGQGGDEAQQVRDPDLEDRLAVQVADGEQREAGPGLGPVDRLGGGHLHRLLA